MGGGGGIGAVGRVGCGMLALLAAPLTCSTSGWAFGVTAGIVKIPAICGVTRIMIEVEGSVVPLMSCTSRVRPLVSNFKPETTGILIGFVPSPKFVMVNWADSPNSICAG